MKYTSNKSGLRFEKETANFSKLGDSENKVVIRPDEKFQEIDGFGGAFTDSVGINILSLEEDIQNKLMRYNFLYFSYKQQNL